MMNYTSAAYRIKIGTLLILWALIAATLSGIYISINISSAIINTVFVTGAALISGGLLTGLGHRKHHTNEDN